MGKLSKSFSARLTAIILLISSLLFVAAIFVVSMFAHNLISDEARKNAANVLQTATLDINMTLEKIESSVSNMQWIVYERRTDSNYMYHVTEEVVTQNKEIVGSAIAFIPEFFKGKHYFSPYSYKDSVGSIQSKQLGTEDYNYFEMEWFTEAFQTKKPHWSRPYFDEGGGQRMMSTYSYPLVDEQGEVYAILTADIDLGWLDDKICALRPYANSNTLLVTHEGNYIAGNLPDLQRQKNIFTMEETANNKKLQELANRMVSGETGDMTISDIRGISFAVYGPLSNGWSTATISSYWDVFARLNLMHLSILIVSVVGLALLFFLCLRIVRGVTRPLTKFSTAALDMAKGNFQAQLPEVKTEDEMKYLHDSFEYMQNSITHYISELQETTAAKERFESELNIARSIQLNMVPTDFIEREDVSVHALLQPARAVGGDLYDFLVAEGKLFFAIGDVSGKGVPAALVMAVTRAAFRLLGGMRASLGTIIGRINNCLCDGNTSNMFVTLFAGAIDLKTGEMTYCNAGHNPLVIRHPDGRAEYLQVTPNLAAGVFPDFEYKEGTTVLEKGSRLLLYTDGVTEAENAEKAQFGEDKLLEFVRNIGESDTSEKVVNDLLTAVKSFTQDAEQNDDITILAISIPK